MLQKIPFQTYGLWKYRMHRGIFFLFFTPFFLSFSLFNSLFSPLVPFLFLFFSPSLYTLCPLLFPFFFLFSTHSKVDLSLSKSSWKCGVGTAKSSWKCVMLGETIPFSALPSSSLPFQSSFPIFPSRSLSSPWPILQSRMLKTETHGWIC